MHSGVIGLLISLACLQIFFNVAAAQVAVESLAGIGSAQSSSAYSQVGVQQQSPYYPQYYPPYPISDYPYSETGVIPSIFRFIKRIIWRIIRVPLRILNFFKYLISSIFGIGYDYDYGYPNMGYPYAAASAGSPMF